MSDNLIILLGVMGPMILFIAIVVLSIKAKKKRREALRVLATQIGFSYKEENWNFLQDFAFGGTLFPKEDRCRAQSLLEGTHSGMRAAIFDFTYEVQDHSSETPGTSRKSDTVSVFESPRHRLPAFELKRKGVFSGLKKQAKFEGNPEFAERFTLAGSDMVAIQRAFNPEVLQVLSSTRPEEKLHLKGEGRWLTFWAPLGSLKADKWRGFLERNAEISAEFFRAAVRG